jgi:hypothetical protein
VGSARVLHEAGQFPDALVKACYLLECAQFNAPLEFTTANQFG